jgi:hypothetical protein
MKRYQLLIQSFCLCLFCMLTIIANAFADRRPLPFSTVQEQQAFTTRAKRFAKLWLSRRQQNVVPQLLAMLSAESSPQLREHIVVALGRIEDRKVLPTLDKVYAKAKTQRAGQVTSSNQVQWRDNISLARIQLARGRIQARQMNGLAKLNRIAREVGTDWLGIQRIASRLRTQMRDSRTLYQALKSDELIIIEEFHDVLYRMGKRGEDIRKLGAFNLQLWSNGNKVPDVLHSSSQTLLSTSSMSDQQEVAFWLNRAMPPNKGGFDPGHFLDLGPTAKLQLFAYMRNLLRKAQTQPETFTYTRSYRAALQAAAETGDQRYLPLLQQLSKTKDRWVQRYARQSLRQLGNRDSVVAFP